jgi:hypothetical protein
MEEGVMGLLKFLIAVLLTSLAIVAHDRLVEVFLARDHRSIGRRRSAKWRSW